MTLNKDDLRTTWKRQWPQFKPDFPNWSLVLSEHIAQTPEFASAEFITIFYPRAFEVDLLSLWKLKPTQVLFPRVDAKANKISFFKVDALSDLKPSKMRIMEPPPSTSHEVSQFGSSDLILIPGMVFDEKGGRIGSGAGYYDRFLAKDAAQARKYGVAFSPQVQKQKIPQESFDIRMDALVTEKGIIYF